MGAGQGAVVGGSLLAVCMLMSGAEAMEPAQSATLVQADLPAFLTDERLPDIEAAWQVQPSEAGQKPASADGSASAQNTEAAESAARAAMKRAEVASREAAAVRRRAEELSRRFSASGAEVTPEASAPSGIVVPAALAEAKPEADASEPGGTGTAAAAPVDSKPFGVGGPVTSDDGAAPPAAQPATQQAAIDEKAVEEKPAETKPEAVTRVQTKAPPFPVRAPRAAMSKAAASGKKEIVAQRPETLPWRPTTKPPKTAKSDVFNNFLRSFGWNTQPN